MQTQYIWDTTYEDSPLAWCFTCKAYTYHGDERVCVHADEH